MIINEHAGTHDMYLPKARARRTVAPIYQSNIEADPNGSHEQRQAWMRQRQEMARFRKPPQSQVKRHPNSIIARLAEQFASQVKGVL